jgi:hypothetical protein
VLVIKLFTAKKPKPLGGGLTLIVQTIQTKRDVNSRLRAVFYYLCKIGNFIVRTKFVPKQKRLNHGYLFFDNKKPSKEGGVFAY